MVQAGLLGAGTPAPTASPTLLPARPVVVDVTPTTTARLPVAAVPLAEVAPDDAMGGREVVIPDVATPTLPTLPTATTATVGGAVLVNGPVVAVVPRQAHTTRLLLRHS